MKSKLKKMWPAAAASLVAFTSLLNAADDKMQSSTAMTRRGEGPNREINPAVNPRLEQAHDWYLTGSVLFWNSRQDGLDFAIESDFFVAGGAQILDESETKEPKHKWEVGFRAGVGYVFDHDGWDAYLNWTHFRNRTSRDEDADTTNSSEVLLALWSDTPTTAGHTLLAQEIETEWKLELDLIDLELGREFYTSKWLCIRPHMGVRGANIRQRYEIEYLGTSLDTLQTTSNVSDEVRMKNYFDGIGVRGGLNSMWTVGSGWSIYGNFAMSILYGYFKTKVKEEIRPVINAAEIDVLELERHFRTSRAVLDLALGLQYDHTFLHANTHLAVSLGWEHHMFFNQNQLWRVTKVANAAGSGQNVFTSPHGDLSTQGWTLTARLDF
ncbi:MAG: Lpg1974 family pore-forming outer membrane protein [Anaerolineae bacterium]